MIIGPINSGAAVGGAGVATATGTSSQAIDGLLYAVQIKYNDSPPAGTTDVTIATKGTQAPVITVLTITNGATDGMYYPRVDSCGATGAALSQNMTMMSVCDFVQVTIAQANAADNVDVWLYVLA